MSNTIHYQLLAECPETIPELAQLWMQEIGELWIPNASVEKAQTTYNEHCQQQQLPLTYVALNGKTPIGMASLRENDGIRPEITPWLGSVIVHPQFRRQKIGEKLVDLVKEKALALGFSKLYLFTLDATIPSWYKQLGWQAIGQDKLYHHPVCVMEIGLQYAHTLSHPCPL